MDVKGRKVWAFCVHRTDFPNQPTQLLNIPYGTAPFLKTADEAIASAKAARGPALDLLGKDLNAAKDADAAFLSGHFSEPSHLDWTAAAATAGHHPMAVVWPTSQRVVTEFGFTDLFRSP